ncbi:MAG: RIP metalloprotease RseP, partial [Bdellovibrionaceae bacterium]|nr:RIP metalloprotease RseP [Pseudobdellovibrionaceae bacterium]
KSTPPDTESLGIESPELYLGRIIPDTPAALAGLRPNDKIIRVNQTKVRRWEDVLESIKSSGGEPVNLLVLREGKELAFSVTPKATTHLNQHGQEERRYTIGIITALEFAPAEIVKISASDPLSAGARAIKRSWDATVMTIMSFVALIKNEISPKNIGGIISIGQAASETYRASLSQFLSMMALISINLFILNLLPIPVLDGGHLVFYLVELVKGSPLNLKKMELAQQLGIVLLLTLMAYALFNDFSRIFSAI